MWQTPEKTPYEIDLGGQDFRDVVHSFLASLSLSCGEAEHHGRRGFKSKVSQLLEAQKQREAHANRLFVFVLLHSIPV